MIKILLLMIAQASAGIVDSFPKRHLQCIRPAGASIEVSERPGTTAVVYELGRNFYLEAVAFGWHGGGLLRGGLKDAAAYLEFLKNSSKENLAIVEPAVATTFQGYPAWTMTRRYRITSMESESEGIDIQEAYFLIQRKWGYVILQYSHEPSLFKAGLPQFEEFKKNIVLLPEPPLSPAVFLFILVLLAGGLIGSVICFRKRRVAT